MVVFEVPKVAPFGRLANTAMFDNAATVPFVYSRNRVTQYIKLLVCFSV